MLKGSKVCEIFGGSETISGHLTPQNIQNHSKHWSLLSFIIVSFFKRSKQVSQEKRRSSRFETNVVYVAWKMCRLRGSLLRFRRIGHVCKKRNRLIFPQLPRFAKKNRSFMIQKFLDGAFCLCWMQASWLINKVIAKQCPLQKWHWKNIWRVKMVKKKY